MTKMDMQTELINQRMRLTVKMKKNADLRKNSCRILFTTIHALLAMTGEKRTLLTEMDMTDRHAEIVKAEEIILQEETVADIMTENAMLRMTVISIENAMLRMTVISTENAIAIETMHGTEIETEIVTVNRTTVHERQNLPETKNHLADVKSKK